MENNLTKEKIIKEAFKFHAQKNIKEAVKYYQYFLDRGFEDARVFSNYGAILKELGNIKQAEKLTRKAIKINPNFTIAYSNLGQILTDLGKLEEAENFIRKAIKLNPKFSDAHLNLGVTLIYLKRLKEADNSLREAIKLVPEKPRVHFHLGHIAYSLGNLKEAEEYTRKEIQINPNTPGAHYNLGVIYRDMGSLEKAEIAFKREVLLDPNHALSHFNLGNISYKLGKLKDAEISTRKSIKLNPENSMAFYNLGIILTDLEKPSEGLDYFLKVIELNPNLERIYSTIVELFRNTEAFDLQKSKLEKIFKILLRRDDVNHRELFGMFSVLYKSEFLNILNQEVLSIDQIESVLNKEVIRQSLKRLIFKDIYLEKVLINFRKKLCNLIDINDEYIDQSKINLIVSLGEQCFLNEYVFSYSKEEEISINNIINKCNEGELDEPKIAILACYIPLFKLLDQIPSLKNFVPIDKDLKNLIKSQLLEPLKEIEISKNIKTLGEINNEVSKKVKAQYEENPYPRWKSQNAFFNQKLTIEESINIEIKPNRIPTNKVKKKLEVLVAGCGTGYQIFNSLKYEGAQITAIDFSLGSLSYAQRKLDQFGITNVELLQMDLLEIRLLEKQFDVIECGGVLHHLDNPLNGLKTLLSVLRENGFLKLALYSELARQDIVAAREYISNQNLQSNAKDIRKFREKILDGKLKDLDSLRSFADFFTLSECRDLCFHAQEHRFNILQLKEIFDSNKLTFLGFLLPKRVKSIYENYFPGDKKNINLSNWQKFEEKYPRTFRSMYQFWVRKN